MKKICTLLLAATLLLTSVFTLFSCSDPVTSTEYTRTEDGISYTLTKKSDNSFEMKVVEVTNYDAAALAAIGVQGEGITSLKATSTYVYTGSWSESAHDEDEGESVTTTSLTYSTAKRTVVLEGDAKDAYLTKLNELLVDVVVTNKLLDKSAYPYTEEKNDEGAITAYNFTLVDNYRNGVEHTVSDKPASESIECNDSDNTYKIHTHDEE